MPGGVKPNILFLMCDGFQGRVLDADHPCQTPNLRKLAASGVRVRRAYTPNPVSSPARSSLMTGLLPHNHGVLEVVHCVDEDQCVLRAEKPHWAQRLQSAGYRTAYFGKWHLERKVDLQSYGWQVNGSTDREYYNQRLKTEGGGGRFVLQKSSATPPGYKPTLHYAVTEDPPAARHMGQVAARAEEHLDRALREPGPWCCMASLSEPNEPPLAGREAFARYDVDRLPLPPNLKDNLEGRPGVYRKLAESWREMTGREHREARACYFAAITEIDGLYGRLMEKVRAAGQWENTIVVFTADHGVHLGAHGLYHHNYGAFEEVYHIPMLVAGPGLPRGVETSARVGLHDLGPTLLELAGAPALGAADSRSFASALRDPKGPAANFSLGYSENHGTRYRITQRILWDGDWKLVHNGFDYDELYNLAEDPWELANLARVPAQRERLRTLMCKLWKKVRETNDHALLNSHWPGLRVAEFGPMIEG